MPQRDRPLLSCPLATGERRPLSPQTWRSPTVSVSWVLVQEKPVCYHCLVRRLPLAVAAAGLPASPLFFPLRAWTQEHRKAIVDWATLAWPEPRSLTLGWVRLTCPGPQWDSLGRWVAQHKNPAGASPPCPGWSVCPTHTVQPPPMSCQWPPPTGATLPTACPRASRAAVCGVAPSPPGAGWAHPPLLSTLSWGVSLPIFECDFKEWKMRLCVFIKMVPDSSLSRTLCAW